MNHSSPNLVQPCILISPLAGIPTWSLGRRFRDGVNLESNVPEVKLTLWLGIFGSAFCAPLYHYYEEFRPFLGDQGWGWQRIDELIKEVVVPILFKLSFVAC